MAALTVLVRDAGPLTAGWDEFAMAAGASLHASLGWLAAWRLRNFGNVRRFEIIAGDRKIGQSAVLSQRGRHLLHDGVQLAPEAAALWPQAMAALLRQLGPGDYRLGARWRPVATEAHALAQLPGIAVRNDRRFTVHAVEFERWPDWDSYWHDVSSNIRRNVARAQQRAELQLEIAQGTRALLALPAVVKGSLSTHGRKALGGSGWPEATHVVGAALACRHHLMVAAARHGRRFVAGNASIAFGRQVHYLGGGGQLDGGAGWLLMQGQLRAAWALGPGARFIMGPFDADRHDEAIGGGLLRSRRACRVSDLPAAITEFSFAG